MTEHVLEISLDNGRRLAYCEYGDPDGLPVVYHHGLLGSRLEAALSENIARTLGLRLIAIDRPGCGRSDPKPDRTLLDWPRDVAALAGMLRLSQFHALGISGGGPYAMACARSLPGQVTGLTLVCSLGPPDSLEHLEPGAGTRLFEFAGRHRLAAGLALAPLGLWMRRSPIGFLERMMARASAADRTVLRDPVIGPGFARSLREGVRQGVGGALTDIGLYTRDWGFSPEEITVPTRLWEGEDDHTVPPSVARHLAEHLSGCEMHLLPGEGHFSLPVRHMSDIFTHIKKCPNTLDHPASQPS